MRCSFGHVAKLVDGVAIAHRPVTVATDWPQVVNVGRATLTLWDVMAALKSERCNQVLAPANQTLVLEALADMDQPHLLSKSLRKLQFHSLKINYLL
jgi:hypothetical protein